MTRLSKARARRSQNVLRKSPPSEIEVKLPVADRQVILANLRRLKASGGKRVHEMNTIYDKLDRALFLEGKMIRIRIETPATVDQGIRRPAKPKQALLTYKGPNQSKPSAQKHGYKVREEQEVLVEDALVAARILGSFGLEPSFRYEKYRTTYRLPRLKNLLVELDETPIGDFLELEGPPQSIDQAAMMLGFSRADYIDQSYAALFFERQDTTTGSNSPSPQDPRDMLFPPSA